MSSKVELVTIRGREAEIRVEGKTHFVPFVVTGDRLHFAFGGETYLVDLRDKSGRGRARHRDHSLEAPMPGTVLKLLVEKGAEVAKGAPLVILEAMKMEHTITAPKGGRIASVNCREGEMVQPGVELIEIE
jgi:3-methylcrotonyl-CoA carboxylase alpha subunit